MDVNKLNDTQLLALLSSEMTIYEDVQGSKIFVNIDGDEITIIPKKISNTPINMVDLTMQQLYMDAFSFFLNLPKHVKSLISSNWYFGFEYFCDEQPANISYNHLPKNKLVLTSIYKGTKFKYTYEELVEYARLFDCDVLPVIFKGKLDDESILAIKMFLNTSKEDLEFVFEEENFAFFFYKLLNPQLKNSFLMTDEYQVNLEKLIISVDGKSDVSFEILNPLYNRISSNNQTNYAQSYSMIIVHFLTFCQTINLENLKLQGTRKDDIYIRLICRIFNSYIEDNYMEIENFDFILADFFNKDKFKINTKLIPNKSTIELLYNNEKLEYVFKCILSSFNRTKKNEIGILKGNSLVMFNSFVLRLNELIDKYIGIKKEKELSKLGLIDFGAFYNIKYDTDLTGNVYLQKMQQELDKSLDTEKKDKKGMDKGKFKNFTKDINTEDGSIGFE
jgi:hypothetical protein